jgi:hypothetical protein
MASSPMVPGPIQRGSYCWLHGAYYRWTGIIAGKRTTKTISQQEAAECQKRIRHYRALQKKVGQLVKQSLKKAPWHERPLKHQ